MSVESITAALLFLAELDQKMQGDVFIISDKDKPRNNYGDIEEFLMHRFGSRDHASARFKAPEPVLRMVLKLAGRSNSNSRRIYGTGVANFRANRPAEP